MGLTQHRNAVANDPELVNLLLLRGHIGRPGAGRLPGARPQQRAGRPHHGHLGAAARTVPRRAGPRVRLRVAARAGLRHGGHHRGDARGRGRRSSSRWAATSSRPTPDTDCTAEALRRCRLTVHVATKLNRSHLVTGRAGADPALPRPHRADGIPGGSSSRSRTRWAWCSSSTRPAGAGGVRALLSEAAIVAGLAQATLGGSSTVDWDAARGRLRPHPRPHRARRPRLRGLQPPRARAGRLLPAEPAARAQVRHLDRQGALHGGADLGARPGPRPVSADDHPQPRPVQHHDLRAERPLPRRRTAAGA